LRLRVNRPALGRRKRLGKVIQGLYLQLEVLRSGMGNYFLGNAPKTSGFLEPLTLNSMAIEFQSL
jgi:hypothetical protein